MQTECSAERSMFGRVEGRSVVAEFDGGALTSDAGGLLFGRRRPTSDVRRGRPAVGRRRPTSGPGSPDCAMFS